MNYLLNVQYGSQMNLSEFEKLNFDNIERRDSVIIEFGPFESLDIIHEVDLRLIELIPENLGAHDMHEIDMNETKGRFFTYGSNAGDLFRIMLPVLKAYEFLRNASVSLIFLNGEEVRDLEFNLSTITAD